MTPCVHPSSTLLRGPFARLFAAQVAALVGTGLSTIALALLARDISGGRASVVLGTALALKMVVYVFIAPLASAALARLPRKWLLTGLDWGRALVVALMPFATKAWHVYALIVLLNAAAAAFKPLFQATVADAVPDEDQYTQALSLTRLAYDLENLLSPLLGAALLLFVSYDALFMANGGLFLLSSVLLLLSKVNTTTTAEGSPLSRALSGFSAYLRTPRLQSLGWLSLSVAAVGAMVIVNTVSLVRDHFRLSESAVAVAMGGFGLGSLCVALTLPRLVRRFGEAVLMRGGIALAALSLLVGWLTEPGYWALLGLWLVAGAGSSAVQTPAGKLLRRSAHPDNQAELYATHFSVSHLCWLLTYPLAGWLYSFAPGAAFGVLGGLALVGLLVSVMVWRSADEGPLEHTHDAFTHAHGAPHDEAHPSDEAFPGLPHARDTLITAARTRKAPRPLSRHFDSRTHGRMSSHRHAAVTHTHPIVLDAHHQAWPGRHSWGCGGPNQNGS